MSTTFHSRKRRRTSAVFNERRLVSYRRNALAPEMKYHAGTDTLTMSSSFSFSHDFTKVSQGTENYQRLGGRVYAKFLRINYVVRPGVGTGFDDQYNRYRIIFFAGSKDESYTPTNNGVFSDPWVPSTVLGLVQKLYDKTEVVYTRFNGDENDLASIPRYRSITIPLNRVLTYGGEAGTVYPTVGVSCAVASDSSTPPHPDIEFNYYFGFYDV